MSSQSEFPGSGRDHPNTQFFSFRIKNTLKDAFDDFCFDCGLTMRDAVCMLVRKTISIREIPFKVEPYILCDLPVDEYGHMKSQQVNIRMDREMLEDFSIVCDEIGVTKSVLVKMYFIRCLNDNALPFWGVR